MAERAPTRTAPGTPAIRFEAESRKAGRSTIVRLPDDASAQLPSRGQVAVKGVMNGYAFQTVLEPDGRRGHWLKVDKKLRTALADAPGISESWKSITPMARWEWVRWINATKNLQTRERRIEVGISKLRSGKRRPCCFDLAAC